MFTLFRQDTQRRFAVVLAVSALTLGSVLVAGPAQAASTKCNPVAKRYTVTEASVKYSVGTITINTNNCRSGSKMTSSSASMKWDPSPLGTGAGWRFDNNTTSRRGTDPQMAGWVSTAVMKICAPTQISPLCSYGETFKVTYTGYTDNFVGPQVQPAFKCTNSYCKLHFKKA
ncbi:hypothetical protein [Curtobacterium caseinilyticum]|uniref:Secreted protein n=1 Tax=Curtobacterium caseinilyticum TaxID=3055137 RepID=A0ABT7TPB5_9MICO|nr:hypothetical protein [Curtobacterium caseinilyticum]MDM7891427.1 hypothetical protein [Curtobacterium caseinilyticum]